MITVSKNKRYLEKDGKYFPYLADTGWTLLQKLTREEIVFYLDTRKKQGFNAIQVSAISELDGINLPNTEGRIPFLDADVFKPDLKYFDLLLFLIDECEKRDIVLTLLPTWGDKFNIKWGIGPEIFTPSNSGVYGEFLADLIGTHENIIFMLGGDRPIENDTHRQIIDNMATGIKKGEKVRHLITYHPCGEASSSSFLKNCDYIDFNSLQSGHSFGGFESAEMIKSVLKAENKPCLDAECFYEDFPIDFNLDFGHRFNQKDIRARIYGNMMAGSLGSVYGHQSVWCFMDRQTEEYPFDWKTALFRPMAEEIKNINIFLNNIDITNMKPYKKCYTVPAISDKKRIVILMFENKPAYIRLPDKQIECAKRFDIVKGTFTDAELKVYNNSAIIKPYKNEAIFIIDFEN